MKTLLILLIGICLGFGLYIYLGKPRPQTGAPVSARQEESSTTNVSSTPAIDKEKIKEELARTGRVIREKARTAGHAVADATANARTTAAIKAKLLQESSLAALKIDVDTTDGVVTLSGTVSSPEEIARAMEVALSTEGVDKVISTLQVKPKQ